MRENFDVAYAVSRAEEGGYSNHPADPGGPTNFGVIQREYDAFRRNKGLPTRSVKLIEEAEVREIYLGYWKAGRCDDLPAGVDLLQFDGNLNAGVVQSTKWLQRSLGEEYQGSVDGQMGPLTLDAVKRAIKTPEDAVAHINDICDQRLDFYRSLKTWPSFGKGWSARVARLRTAAQKVAAKGGAAISAPPPVDANTVARAPVSQTSASSVVLSKDGALASIPVVTAAINAAANPGPMAWAVAIVIVIAAAGALFYVLKTRRTP